MRTRFLATDYFSVPSTSEALKDFQALYLPAPNFFSPGPVLTVESLLLVPDYSIQHEIDRFPFEEALTDFLSDVIPRFLGAGERRSGHGSTEMQFTPSFERNQEEIRSTGCEMECFERADGSICKEMEVEKRLEVNSCDFNDILPEQSFLLFEIAEVAEFPMWELGISCEENEAMLFFEIPGVSVPLDYIDVEMEISIASPYEVDRLLCIIEDVPDILIFCQESFSAKDGESLQDNKLCLDINLPNFEIGESVLGIHESESMNETFNDLLSSLKPRKNDDELVVNAKDFLGPTNDNFSEHFLTQDISEYGLDHRPLPLNSLLELDLINLNGCILLEKQSVMYPMVSNENSPHIPCSAQLEEVQVLDRTFNVLDIFNSFESVEKEGYFEQMCEEEKGHMETFYESVLNSELSLIDDQFKFLPAPIFSDDKVLKSKFMIMEDIFIALKPHSFSVCDEIYLDWHPLLEGVCNNEACSTFMSMMQEVVSYRIDTSELKSQYEPTMHSDFDFIDDSLADLSIVQHEELTDVHQNCPDEVVLAVDTVVTETVNHDIKESNGAKQIPKNNPAKISSLLESISQSNDLNFFLGVRKGSADISSGFETCNKDRPSIRITSGDAQQELSEASIFSESNIKKIEVHKATLSGYTLSLIEQIEGAYFSNLNKCKHLISNSTSSTTMELLSIPKGRLLKLISEKGGSQCTSGSIDEAFVGLLAIYAIKQLAHYLCFFGIHVAYLYVSICSSKVNNLAGSLQPLQSLLQDAHWKAEKQIIESHPSLSLIEGLLRSNTSKGCKKTLIISNEAFWPSLKHKLTTLKISFSEVGHPCCPSEQLDIMDNCRSQNSILDALSHSDCLLLSYENISASFPFNMFTNILEYGGPRATSRISEIFPSLGSFPCVHFIRFDMENHYLAKTLCEGFEASKNSMISLDGLPRYMDYLQGCLNDQNTEGLLTQFPLDKACNNSRESVWAIDPSLDNDYAMNMQHLSSSNKATAKPCSVPEVVIIVNTQNLDKNLIISRRSSYQKILELEKRGVQVVERDINLPLDLIFSCAVCLVWYEARNIMDKTGVNMSAIPAFIENIATKILTSLSFAFSGCILIFEGERNFLASIMESSDMLYAAAASLDLNLQLFCSHMPETTDDIILNCIRSISTKDGGLYSAMPESECIAESFLTKFPSLNPLSAHAILSSGGMLVEFFQWSPERRIQAIGKYKVPAEIISLCNALCRYGELGESKSVMTDCSSVDSDNSSSMLQSKRKKLTYAMSYATPGMLVDESFYVEPNQMYHNNNMMPQSSQPYHSKNFRFHDVPEKAQFFRNGNILERKHELNSSKLSNIGRDTVVRRSDPHNEFYNDAFDYNCNVLDEPCASMPRSRFNLRRSDLTSEPIVEKFLSSNRLLDGHTCSFPTSTEINRSENDLTDSYEKNGLEKESGEIKTSFFNKELLIKRNNFLRQNHRETPELRNKANRIPYLNESLRSNPSQPSQQQYRQKDIIESIGQANERSRVHPQFSCNTCLSCPGSLKRKAVCQKKSPSIIDRFRYRGGNKQAKGTVNKQKSFTRAQPSRRDLVSKDSALIIPSWTPIDKRARQHLSFVRTGNEQQSRLAWRRSDSPRVLCSSRKRQRNDV